MKEYIEAIIEKIEISPIDIICDSATGPVTPLPWDHDEDDDTDSFYMDRYYGK